MILQQENYEMLISNMFNIICDFLALKRLHFDKDLKVKCEGVAFYSLDPQLTKFWAQTQKM